MTSSRHDRLFAGLALSWAAASLGIALCEANGADGGPGAKSPADIGSRWELLVDDWLIDSADGVSLKLAEPERREVVLVTDAPWEGPTSAYFSVVQDGEIVKVSSPDDHDITRGNLCIKGRFGFQHVQARD